VHSANIENVRCIPVPDPLDIPEALTMTMRGREVDAGDINSGERFLLYTGQEGKLLVFCAASELSVLYQTEYLVCDSTFEMAPQSAYQVYTIHGYVHDEGVPLLWALLPNKTTASYTELFTAVRNALLTAFRGIGQTSYLICDFEMAAINAVTAVFPELTIKGCSFHFRQALMRRLQNLGLRSVYHSETEYPSVRNWLREIMAMSMLPSFAVPLAWQVMKQHPVTGSSTVDSQCASFAEYFNTTWVIGDFSPAMWTHFDHLGPRTTSLAEGWHNSLNSQFGMPHPSLQSFLNWLQKCQFGVQCRLTQLASGRPTKQRASRYVRLDQHIQDAKVHYSATISHIFAYIFPKQEAWSLFYESTYTYLRRVGHLVGVK